MALGQKALEIHQRRRREARIVHTKSKSLSPRPLDQDTKGQREQEQVMPANHVEKGKPSAMENVQHVGDAYILEQAVITAMAKVGRSASTAIGALYFQPATDIDRRTAEDLTFTSRRLARYEELLKEITPLVSPEVRSMIDVARQQVGSYSTEMMEY